MKHPAFVTLAILAALAGAPAQTISTVAGNGTSGFSGDNGPATSAALQAPWSVALDSTGNLYIADYTNFRIRKVNLSGVITTFAGCGPPTTVACILAGLGEGGPATAPIIYGPFSIVIDGSNNLFVGDTGQNLIRKITPSGTITTIAGGGRTPPANGVNATSASLGGPIGLAVDSAGNIYYSDLDRNQVWKVSTSGTLTLVAGNGKAGFSGDGGQATAAMLNSPHGIFVDAAGSLFITDTNNFRVRKVDPAGIITTIAGTGGVGFNGEGIAATSANLNSPQGIAVDSAGTVYIAEPLGSRVRKVTAGIITTVAGNGTSAFAGDGGPPTSASLNTPSNIAFDPSGALYIADTYNNRVRKLGAAPLGLPAITANGIVNGASFQPGVVPNSWATIVGTNLAATSGDWNTSISGGRLPTTLNGVTVTIGGKPAYLNYVSQGQINLIVPDIGAGPVQVTVTTAGGTSTAFTVNSSLFGPAFFPWPGNQVVATRQDFTLAAKAGTFGGANTVAAKPSDVIILWGTGFGPTAPTAPAGTLVPGDKTYLTATMPVVTLNNAPVTVYGAALAPGYVGLYQVAIQVPATIADGDWPLQATIGGAASPTGLVLSVKR